MNKYGWGSMMDDYCFLEDVGRRVGEWGREIVKGGFDMSVRGNKNGAVVVGRDRSGRGRGGGVMGRNGSGRGGKRKREVLKMLLEVREIELELLPSGMERRMLNQSVWDQKYVTCNVQMEGLVRINFDRNQTALLTIQFKFHPPAEAQFAPSSDEVKSFLLLTHRNKISMPLLSLVQKQIQERMHKKSNSESTVLTDAPPNSFPSWISSLVIPPPEDPENFTIPTFVMTAPSDPSLVARSAAFLSASTSTQKHTPECVRPKLYYSLDPNEPLAKSLRGTQFVEFPLIEAWEEFKGVIIDKKTGGVRYADGKEEPQRKRRKLNPEEGKKAIVGLVGDYGSDDDEIEKGHAEESASTKLVGYVESDIEEDDIVDEEIVLDEDEWTDADADGDIDLDADPAVILELMEQVKREGKWMEESDDDSDDSRGQGQVTLHDF